MVHSWSLCLGEFPPISGRKTHSCTGWRCGLGRGQAAEQLEMGWEVVSGSKSHGRTEMIKHPAPWQAAKAQRTPGSPEKWKGWGNLQIFCDFHCVPQLPHSSGGRGGNLIGLRYVNTISAPISRETMWWDQKGREIISRYPAAYHSGENFTETRQANSMLNKTAPTQQNTT